MIRQLLIIKHYRVNPYEEKLIPKNKFLKIQKYNSIKWQVEMLLLPLKVQNLMGYPVHILLEKMAS